MNDPIDELEALLTGLAEHAPRGVTRASVAHRVSARRRRRTAVRIGGGVACVAAVTGGIVTVRGRTHDTNGITVGTSSTVGVTTTIAGHTSVAPSFPAADPGAQNFLITGADSNACVDPHSPWAGAADPARNNIGTRSDTIMVMRVDPATHRAAILSFPRDLWVNVHGRGNQRINSAYVENDYSLLAQTIYDNFGVNVDHYVQIDFCAFTRIVDAVGGVAVPFDTPLRDSHVGLNITTAGCHTFSGDEALAYVRSRHLEWIDKDGTAHPDPSGDLGRIARQQDFLRRVLDKAVTSGQFTPSVALALIKSLQTDIVTEQGFTLADMLKFAGVLKDIDPKAIRHYQIDATGIMVSGNSVLQPQLDSPNMHAVLAIFRGTNAIPGSTDQPTATATTNAVAPHPVSNGEIVPNSKVEC
jgi:LCP family protein required for cell wall assembly